MKQFNYVVKTKLMFGFGQLEKLHNEVLPGKKALVVTSRGNSVKKYGYLERLLNQLDMAGVSYAFFDKIQPNPTVSNVMEGAETARKNECDFVIGLGGGSVIDASKMIAFSVTNPGDFWEYTPSMTGGNKAPVGKPLPVIAVTTTAGTGTEVDPWGVITKEETSEKSGFGYDETYPVIAVVDPSLMMSVPSHYTAYQGMDAFFHAAESYLNVKNNYVGKMFAIEAIRHLSKYLPIAVKNGDDKEAREHVALGNTLAGYHMVCISKHSMEHAMSGFYPELPHGAGLIMLSHAYYEFFAKAHVCDKEMIEMAKAMGIENAEKPEDFISALDTLLQKCNVDNLKMSDYGIKTEDFTKFAEYSRKILGGDFEGDPKALSDADIISIYRDSYK